VQAAAAAVEPELSVLVVLDMTDDDRKPHEVADYVRRALEICDEQIIHVADLPPGTRILAPGERNGRA
jgi:hypothetical protein